MDRAERKNRVSGLGQDFSLSPVEPTLTFFCIGSTGELSFHVLGFLGFSVVAPVHQTLHASDQPVLLLFLLFRSFNWRIDFPRRRLNRCFDFASVGLTGAR